MGDIFLINQFGELFVSIGSLVAVGTVIYFIVRYQTVKFLRIEIEAYKSKVDRLEEELERYKLEYRNLESAYNTVKEKKNYWKSIIKEAVMSKVSVDDELLNEIKLHLDKNGTMKKGR